MKACHYCGDKFEADDLRPYGPGGTYVCFTCAMGTPERKAETERQLAIKMDAAGPIAVLTPDGPQPLGQQEAADPGNLVLRAADVFNGKKGSN